MELRRDPITRDWVIQEDTEAAWPPLEECPLCPGQEGICSQTIYRYPLGSDKWLVRVTPHPRPLYRIEGDAQRRAEGLYDRMRNLGAHEVVIEHPDHHQPFTLQEDEDLAQVLRAYVVRVNDLKRDRRFRYVLVFRNQGVAARQDLEHPHSQIIATPFIPRPVVYELRSLLRYFELKDRCLLCDIIKQELADSSRGGRAVEWDDQFVAFCPFASRVPYETWVLPIRHHYAFEEDLEAWERQISLARFLKSVLRRLEAVASAYRLVLHTSPNLNAKYEKSGHWRTLVEDFHWHIEILPVYQPKSRSYGLKEVRYNSVPPEAASKQLREMVIESEIRR